MATNNSRAVSVGTTATRLDSDQLDFNSQADVAAYNNSTKVVWVGASDVTVGTGIPLAAASAADVGDGGVYSETFFSNQDHLWAIVASGTADVRVREVGI